MNLGQFMSAIGQGVGRAESSDDSDTENASRESVPHRFVHIYINQVTLFVCLFCFVFWLEFTSHQHCKRYMATSQVLLCVFQEQAAT